MKRPVKGNVSWVGKTDWELRRFHGNELSTAHGSSYNAYIIEEEKTVLIDTVWIPYADEFVRNLEEEGLLSKIDFIVANHGEIDHSGALPALMERIPNTPIYCSANAVKSLKGQYHADWDFHVVKTRDRLPVGNGKELVFIELPMLHWPDSMAAFLTGDNILFSNDAFGQHYAFSSLFNDGADPCVLLYEAMKYYANILAPFSDQVRRKLDEIAALNLPFDLIAPSHGLIWRENPMQIVEKYSQWCRAYQENQVTIVYDTMYNGTRALAESIAEGLLAADKALTVKLFNISKSDFNDVLTEVFRSKALLAGSPTIARGVLYAMAGFLYLVKEMKLKGKYAAAFGCHGWSGEGVGLLNKMLDEAGFTRLDDGLKVLWTPDDGARKAAFDFGARFAEACRKAGENKA